MEKELIDCKDKKGNYGYSCQVWIAWCINTKYYNKKHYVWFSKEFDPFYNTDSSNPMWLYLWIDRAVKQWDKNHPKIKDLKVNIAAGVVIILGKSAPSTAQKLKKEIATADISKFRPQVWRLNLEALNNRYEKKQQPDEFLIKDLKDGEFEIIIE